MIAVVEGEALATQLIDARALLGGQTATGGWVANLGTERFGIRIHLGAAVSDTYWLAYGNKWTLPCHADALDIVPFAGTTASYTAQFTVP